MLLSQLISNPNNPRIIKDEKFKKLVQSIKDFPKMMELRPMIVDGAWVVLGGNMRLQALKEAGYTDIPDNWVRMAASLTEAEKQEFIIKDNVGFGEWDWETLANEWDQEDLENWGLELPNFTDISEGTDGFSLPSGDKAPFQQMTFTLADAQAERVKRAISEVEVMEGTEYGNENSNGNALHQICLEWDEQRR